MNILQSFYLRPEIRTDQIPKNKKSFLTGSIAWGEILQM